MTKTSAMFVEQVSYLTRKLTLHFLSLLYLLAVNVNIAQIYDISRKTGCFPKYLSKMESIVLC